MYNDNDIHELDPELDLWEALAGIGERLDEDALIDLEEDYDEA